MNEMNLYLKNETRKAELLKSEEYKKFFLIEVIREDEGSWYKKGEKCVVRKYPFKATSGMTTTYCHCKECIKEREGKELFDMFEVILAEEPLETKITELITTTKIGAIIPVEACKIIKVIKK